MLRIFSRRSNKVRIILCTFILTFAILHVTPVEVTASTEIISEDFTDITYKDSQETNASWWGDGSLRIPPTTVKYTDYCELSAFKPYDSYVDGTMMYIALETNGAIGVDIVNISVPASPVLVVSVPTAPYTEGVAVSGSWMYVASWVTGLMVYNITDYQNVQLISSFGPSEAMHIYVEGSYAYLASLDQGIQIFDVSTPQSIVSVANYTTIDCISFMRVTKVGDFLFTLEAGGHDSGVHIVNVTDPTDPTFVSNCSTYDWTHDIFVIDDYVFGQDGLGLFAMSISNISEPTIVNSVAGMSNDRGGLVRDNNYLYGTELGSGLQVVDISDPYDLQVYEINSTIHSHYTTFANGFIYTTRYTDGNEILEAHRLDWAYNAAVSSLSVYETPLDTFSITEATLTADATTPASTSIDYYLSADNGTHWEEVVPGTLHSFSNLGMILKWKVIMDTTAITLTPEISSINISLRVQLNPISLHAHSVTPDYNKPSFTWEDLDGAYAYRFQLDSVNTFDSPNLINEVIDAIDYNLYEIETALENGTYYYRMAAIDEDGDTGIFTNTRHVSVGTWSTTTTTTSTNGSGLSLDPLIFAIGVISIVGLVVVVVIIQKRKPS
ncbi:MAG: hypothetical protein RTU63_01635 [Candidatus Thorarchaeota archaeon]